LASSNIANPVRKWNAAVAVLLCNIYIYHWSCEAFMPVAGKRGVLVVEDDRDLRLLFSLMLSAAQFQVFEAADGLAGLKALEENPGAIDLVLTDLGLPGLGGVELIARVKAARPTVKIIGTSGLGSTNVREMVLGAGADAFFSKPFSMGDVIEKVKTMTQ
jgi:DNA-binding response OmpR family regulator